MKNGIYPCILRWLLACLANLPWLAVAAVPHDVRINYSGSVAAGYLVDQWSVKDQEYQGNADSGTGVPPSTKFPIRVYTERTYYFRIGYQEYSGGPMLYWTNVGPFTVTGGTYTDTQVFNITYDIGPAAPPTYTYTDCNTNKKNYPVIVQYFTNSTSAAVAEKTIQPGATECVTLGPWTSKLPVSVVLYYPSSGVVEDLGTISAADSFWVTEGGGNSVSNTTGRVELSASYASGLISNIVFSAGNSNLATESTLQTGFSQLKQVLIEDHKESVKAIALGNTIALNSQAKLDTIAANVNAVGSAVSTLHADNVNEAGQLSGIGNATALTASRLDDLKTYTATGNGFLSAISDKQTYGNTKLGTLEARLDTMVAQGTAANTSLGAMTVDVDESNTKLTYIRTATEATRDGVDAMRTNATAMHSTMVGMSNRLDAIAKGVGATDDQAGQTAKLGAWQQAGSAAGDSAKADWEAFSLNDPTAESGSADGFLIEFGEWSVDFNPASNPLIANAASAAKTVIAWLVSVVYGFGCVTVMEKYLTQIGSIRQTAAPPVSVFGWEIGPALAMPLAVVITGIIAALPVFAIQWVNGNMNFLSDNPFAGYTSNGFGMAAYLVAYFLPVGVILGHLVSYIVFRTQIAGIWVGVCTAVRYIVGG